MNDLIKATSTEAWEPVKEAISAQLDSLKSIDLLLEINEKEKDILLKTNDPIRVGQMLAYRTLKTILTGMMSLEASKDRPKLTDYL